ncbi:hypothetical protein KDK88_04740, partial [bacterium]|nr:hypothetical protein [bacterium]
MTSELAPYADLQVQNLLIDPAAGWEPGETVTLTWTTVNAGTLAATADWEEQVFIRNQSNNQMVQVQVLPFVDGLDGGASLERSYTFQWPAGLLGTGNFQIVVTTDLGNDVFEANPDGTGETNNASTLNVISAPDLQVTDLQVTSSTIESGATITIEWNDLNAGNVATPAGWYDRIEVTNLETGQKFLNSAIFHDPTAEGNGPLGAGDSLARSFTFQIPHGLAGTGTLRIKVTADRNASGSDALIEVGDGYNAESNNDRTIEVESAARTYPDLTVASLTVPATGRGGTQVGISWTVTNQSARATDATSWTDLVILSTDDVIGNGDDVVIGEYVRSGALGGNASYSVDDFQVTLPLDLDGDVYITVRTDGYGDVIEPDTRDDNEAAPQMLSLEAPFADLDVEAVFGPGTAGSGDVIDVSWRVRNIGDSATTTGAWSDTLYLSEDAVLDASDMALGTFAHNGALGVGASYSVVQSVALPGGVTGSFYLLLATDVNGQVFEKDLEDNNVGMTLGQIEVTPAPAADLTVVDFDMPEEVEPGQEVEISWTVENVGEAASRAPWTDRIYLSQTGTTSGATLLATVVRTFDLAPGATYTATAPPTIPAPAPGDHPPPA